MVVIQLHLYLPCYNHTQYPNQFQNDSFDYRRDQRRQSRLSNENVFVDESPLLATLQVLVEHYHRQCISVVWKVSRQSNLGETKDRDYQIADASFEIQRDWRRRFVAERCCSRPHRQRERFCLMHRRSGKGLELGTSRLKQGTFVCWSDEPIEKN